MMNDVTPSERQVFREAYEFFARHASPPAHPDPDTERWWADAAEDVVTVDDRWRACPLMHGLLLAIYGYLETKARERTEELNDFLREP